MCHRAPQSHALSRAICRDEVVGEASSNLQELGGAYAKDPTTNGKVWFHGVEIEGISASDSHNLKYAGQGYATNGAGVLLYRGKKVLRGMSGVWVDG